MAVSSVELIVNAAKALNPLRKVKSAAKDASQSFGKLQSAAGRTAGSFQKLQSAVAGVGVALVAKSAISAAASFNDLQTRLKLLTSEYGEYKQAQDLVAKSAKTFGLSNREAAEGITDIFARLRPLGVSLRDIESTFVGFNTVAKLSGVNSVQASSAFTQLAQALGSGTLRGDEFNSIAEQVPGLLTAISQETGVAQGKLRNYAAEGKITADVVIKALKRVEKDGASKIKKLIEESDVQKFKDFKDASDALSIAIGQKLLPAVTPLVTAATNLIKGFADLPKPIKDTTIAVVALSAAVVVLNPLLGTTSGLISAMGGAAVIGAAIKGLAALGEAAIATAAGKTVLASAVTAANAKITIATVSAGLLKVALVALPFVAVAGLAAVFAKSIIDANTEQETFNKTLATGTKEQLKNALAIEQSNLARARSFQLNGRGEGRATFQAPIDRAERRIAQLQAKLLGVGVVDESPGKPTTLTKPPAVITPLEGETEEDKKKKTMEQIIQLTNAQSLAQVSLVDKRREENEHLALTASHGKEFADVTREVADLVQNGGLSFTEAFDLVNAGRLLEGQIDKQQELANAQQKAADDLKEKYKQVGDAIKTHVTDSIMDAIDGTKSLGESALGILKDLGKQFLRLGINQAFGALGSTGGILGKLFGGGRASGGTVQGGTSYMVGERGPELFTPGRSGSIAPNNAMGNANVTVNVDASGSSVEGDGDQAAQLGKMLGAAVQAELVKQKRPGGLLAS